MSPLGGDTKCECDSETGDGRSREATSIQDLEEELQTQPQSGSHPTGPLQPSISSALPDNISEETHATLSDSFAHHLEPDTSGPPNILLHHETREGHLEFLLWAPIWQLEDDVAKVHPDQLKQYKERLDVGSARRASQSNVKPLSGLSHTSTSATEAVQIQQSSRDKITYRRVGFRRVNALLMEDIVFLTIGSILLMVFGCLLMVTLTVDLSRLCSAQIGFAQAWDIWSDKQLPAHSWCYRRRRVKSERIINPSPLYHGRDYSERKVEGLDGKRRRWTREEDNRLMALKQDGFSWPEIEERFPHRQLGSLRQRWYTKLQNTHASNPPTDKRRQEGKCRASAGEPLPLSKPPTPLETSHRSPGGQPQPADDPATPNAKPRTPSPSSTVTSMCPVCNSVVEVEASSAFNAANNRMRWSRLCYPIIAWDRLDDRLTQFHPRLRRTLDDPGYRSRYKSVVHKKVRKHGRNILSRSVLHSTGYYGLRGHEILSAHVVSHFKDAIDSLAGINSVASKYGTVVYAQEVLVPELLEMLVQEDMGVDAKGACWILKESNKIGNLLNLE
ncbi:hypothetical protein PAAG_11204 [Paracoccidioides lutzii Pb01]|uniref:Restriction of telomere capping protein 4 n=1 Tax=Paracoccidioides lutzii (strain ATCC MYA-826 / Pb01) TaxID=502779 RepID=A0A0A2V3G1_PARBA|nr:hypothetical protein PAAG_11204 [Paracoccidioides lutzii Pb01]KGQ02028.1 hypothetical protein PAAG_11204 [Paracoccidioides lutzii Pb01]